MQNNPPKLSLKPTRVRYGVLLFACSLSLLAYLDRVCISRVAENIQNDLHISDKMMGFVFSAFIFGYALFEVPGGLIGDRWGARLALTRVVLWWSLFTCLTGSIWYFSYQSGLILPLGWWQIPVVFDSFLLLLLVRFTFGAGEAGAYPNISRAVSTWFPVRERGMAQGSIWMCARLGGFLAPLIIGRLTESIGWRNAFWVLGFLGFVWAVWFFLWFTDTPEQKSNCNQAELDLIRDRLASSDATGNATAVKGSPEHAWPPFLPLLKSVSMWALCGASFGIQFGWYFYPTWQPKFLKRVFDLQVENTELMVGLPFLFGAIGCLLGGRLSDLALKITGSLRWSRSLVGAFGFGGAGICFFLAGQVSTAWQAVSLLCLAALLNDLAIPMIWIVSADLSGRFVGTVSGFMNMVGLLGGVLSPIFIPYMVDRLADYPAKERWGIILGLLAIGWLFSASLWFIIDSSKPIFPYHSPEKDPNLG